MFSNHARGKFWKVLVHQAFPMKVTTKHCFRFSPYQVRLWFWPEQHLHMDARQDGLLWLGGAPPGDQLHRHRTQLWPHTAEQQWWEMPIAIMLMAWDRYVSRARILWLDLATADVMLMETSAGFRKCRLGEIYECFKWYSYMHGEWE